MTSEFPEPQVASGARQTPAEAARPSRGSLCAVRCLTLAIRAYQLTLSPAQTFLFGHLGGCRHTPTCSVYAAEALRQHGVVAGTWLATKRICRCHPWGGCGHDPVPPKHGLQAGGQQPALGIQNSEATI